MDEKDLAKMRVVVAMSGGVDSSVAAALMKEAGHDVVGLAMKTHSLAPKANRACCTPDDMRDARLIADQLEIPFFVLPYEQVFVDEIITPFAEAYRDGYTPNPCVDCNDKVKFKPLLERAQLLGADVLATGHYAQVHETDDGYSLGRGVDAGKDQSYFLYRLTQNQLKRVAFPLGGMTKPEVRDHARRFGFALADKHESQEICFVGQEGYAATVEKILGEGGREGHFVHVDGKVIGKHQGIHRYTIGQRKGLGISWHEPLYVVDIDAQQGAVWVGPRSALDVSRLFVERIHWSSDNPPAIGEEFIVQQRYRGKPTPCRLLDWDASKRLAHLEFLGPEPRGAPGQAAVFYDDDRVIGGGVIAPNRGATQITSLPIVG
ncbi:MAG: tRNA 2-thiouridine(34) synthase MnmA [Myxococcota bacterium]|nr:tRNA 2-thiouridine(34) synthase MnmA [Myxococcota bacterium]